MKLSSKYVFFDVHMKLDFFIKYKFIDYLFIGIFWIVFSGTSLFLRINPDVIISFDPEGIFFSLWRYISSADAIAGSGIIFISFLYGALSIARSFINYQLYQLDS